jgi:hypothetical protein
MCVERVRARWYVRVAAKPIQDRVVTRGESVEPEICARARAAESSRLCGTRRRQRSPIPPPERLCRAASEASLSTPVGLYG